MSVYTHKGKPMLTKNKWHVRVQIKDQLSSSFFVPIYLLSILSALFYGRRLLLLGGIPSRHEPDFSKPFFPSEKEKVSFELTFKKNSSKIKFFKYLIRILWAEILQWYFSDPDIPQLLM